jgi:hypothetical protein
MMAKEPNLGEYAAAGCVAVVKENQGAEDGEGKGYRSGLAERWSV